MFCCPHCSNCQLSSGLTILFNIVDKYEQRGQQIKLLFNPVKRTAGRLSVIRVKAIKAHTDRTRFGNATRIFSFQKQIKPSMDKNFTLYAVQIAKIA